jgi:transcriptional regulator with XRE-family HTH domain
MMKQKSKQNELLRSARLHRGWSQADVAEKIGSDPKTVGRWERGLTFPSLYLRQQLCKLFEQDAESLGIIRKEPTESVEEITLATLSHQTEVQPPASPLTLPAILSERELQPQISQESRQNKLLRNFVPSLPASITVIMLVLFIVSQISASTPFQVNNSRAAVIPVTPNIVPPGYQWLINDALNSSQSTGQPHTVPEGQCFYHNNTYHSRVVTAGNMKPCLTNLPLLHNFAYEVTMRILQGNCGGILFRSNFPLMYYFLICSNGQYRFVRYDRDNAKNRLIIKLATSTAIHPGLGVQNTIAVVAHEQHFILYVNDKSIVQADDGAYQTGRLGMLAHSCRYVNALPVCAAPTEVAFSDLSVWQDN